MSAFPPAPDPPSDSSGDSDSRHLAAHPEHVGPYRILQPLGEGGMGTVYLAEQTHPVRRRVAVKLIKLGMDTHEVVARFEAERQALALMDHPGIARVFDAGATEAGRPFFVMELVPGVPLIEFCDLHRLSIQERIELFLQVCAAVQHAHQKGIIHRDLKPSNVLVALQDARPAVKIIDFGIAKAMSQQLTERTLVTRYGQLMGSPEYMSPEQAEMSELGVDTLTDIYSLGVMLYELLTGTLPFEPKELRGPAAFVTIREVDPAKPSTRFGMLGESGTHLAQRRRTDPASLRKRLRGDLDWIVMKAMAKDRRQRYETAHALAADLRRHLNHEPVAARAPSARYRISKFARRHRAGVAFAAALLVLLVGFAATMTAQAERIARERDRAQLEARTAERVSDFLVDLFRVSNPTEARGNEVTAREILDRGAERIEAELAEEPRIQARLLRTIGRVYRALGLYAAAQPLLERAIALADSVADPAEAASSLLSVGTLYWLQGAAEQAEQALLRALEIQQRHGLGEDERVTIIGSLAALYLQEARYAEAEPLLLEALAIQERVFGRESREVSGTINNLGALYFQQRRLDEAEPYFVRALELAEQLVGENHPDFGDSWNNLGALHFLQKRYLDAERGYQEARRIYEAVYPPDHPRHAVVTSNLAEAYAATGRYTEAEESFLRSLALKERVLAPNHPSIAVTLKGLAGVYREQGRYSQSEDLYRRALEILARRPADDPQLVEARSEYAKLLRVLGRTAEAEELEGQAAGAS